MSSYVVVSMFESKKAAEEAKEKLTKHGISSYAQADKSSGIVPFLTPVVRLFVRSKDHEYADAVLKGKPLPERSKSRSSKPTKEKETKEELPQKQIVFGKPPPTITAPHVPLQTIKEEPKKEPMEEYIAPPKKVTWSKPKPLYTFPKIKLPRIHVPFGLILLLLFLVFLFTRFYRLIQVPIFNDEAIYLDWGWREVTKPNMLFYSLYDAKQPLVMWLFGVSQVLLSDQLFAGRLVAVIFSVATFVGIWAIGKKLLSKSGTATALLLYTVIPLFTFFDRQALMEGPLAAIIVWAVYAYIAYSSSLSPFWPVFIGVVLGIGFFIKTSILLPVLMIMGWLTLDLFTQKKKQQRIIDYGVVLGSGLFVALPILFQPLFWQTLHSNDRYVLTLGDYLSFPLSTWILNNVVFVEAFFVHITFGIGIAIGLGAWKGPKMIRKISYSIGLILIFVLLTSRGLTERYMVSYLPLLVLPAAWMISSLLKQKMMGIIAVVVIIAPAILLTTLQLFSLEKYFQILSYVPSSGLKEYYRGYTSGYGVSEVVAYLSQVAETEKIFVGVALNTGNPESAVIAYFHKHPNVLTGYFDIAMFKDVDLSQYSCVTAALPIYFVSRDEQLAGLDRFLFKRISYENPHSPNSFGIYRAQIPCKERPFYLQMQGG